MSENTKVIATQEQIDAVVERIGELAKAKDELARKTSEVEVHENDLLGIEKTYGADSKEYAAKKVVLDVSVEAKAAVEAKITELTFKRSEIKDVLDTVTKQFEDSLRAEQEREYHIEFGDCKKDKGGNNITPSQNGRKNFKQVMEYLNKDVDWTPSTAAGLMMLVANMDDNRPWVQSAQFDGIVKLRSANILVLWNSLVKGLSGKGYYSAKTFLTLWASCGKALSDAVNKVNVGHEDTRKIGATLNTIQDAFDAADDDLPTEEAGSSIKDEVDPEV